MKPPPGTRAGARWRPTWAYGLLALAVLAGAAWLLLGAVPERSAEAPRDPPPPPVAATTSPAAAAVSSAPVPAMVASTLRAPASPVAAPAASAPGPASDDLAAHVPAGTEPTMNEVIDRLHQAGIRTGLGAFNPPGTRPPLIGLAVPEDFPLPPGYLRHHQATDDGQRIEAILMFDPDHPPPAAAGRPLATPAERVVPAELAPPGLPIRLISLPPPADTRSPRR